jgi:hypothetical protein
MFLLKMLFQDNRFFVPKIIRSLKFMKFNKGFKGHTLETAYHVMVENEFR